MAFQCTMKQKKRGDFNCRILAHFQSSSKQLFQIMRNVSPIKTNSFFLLPLSYSACLCVISYLNEESSRKAAVNFRIQFCKCNQSLGGNQNFGKNSFVQNFFSKEKNEIVICIFTVIKKIIAFSCQYLMKTTYLVVKH